MARPVPGPPCADLKTRVSGQTLGIIAILAALLLPAVTQGKLHAQRASCENNLKQLGVAFHLFMHDHNSRFPMQAPAAEGGSMEFVQAGYRVTGDFYFSFRQFQPLSNDLIAVKLLVCPTDTRTPATNFSKLDNSHLSYFVGVNARFAAPDSMLAGDRNIRHPTLGAPTILATGPDKPLFWSSELHRSVGNILFSDSHVENLNRSKLARSQTIAGDLFLPTLGYGPVLLPPETSGTSDEPSTEPGFRQPPRIPSQRGQPLPSGPGGNGNGDTNNPGAGPQDEPKTPPRNAPPAAAPSSGSGQMASAPATRGTTSPTVVRERPETNTPAPVVTQQPGASPAPDEGTSPLARWFAELAQEIVGWAKWLLWLLLLLLLAALVAMRLRHLWLRKRRAQSR